MRIMTLLQAHTLLGKAFNKNRIKLIAGLNFTSIKQESLSGLTGYSDSVIAIVTDAAQQLS